MLTKLHSHGDSTQGGHKRMSHCLLFLCMTRHAPRPRLEMSHLRNLYAIPLLCHLPCCWEWSQLGLLLPRWASSTAH